jgi:phosphomannomutase
MKLVETLSYQPAELAFGTSGLRGLVTDMTDLECYINTAGFLQFLKGHDNLAKDSTIYLAGDLRESTPRIMRVMVAAIQDAGLRVVNCGTIPTPAVAYYASLNNAACIMVTGSHIPADRNGIKFYKQAGELLKEDEPAMQQAVAEQRQRIYDQLAESAEFNQQGSHKNLPPVPMLDPEAEQRYQQRYIEVFGADCLTGKQVVVYQHSAVGRDLLVELFAALGAETVAVERSEVFIPIDTEHVREEDKALFKQLSQQYPDAFAIISTDGDSDRPFVIDETGIFHPGDVLGAVTADYLGAKFAAVVISSNDAVDTICQDKGIQIVHTKIGSPYVISAMHAADQSLQPLTGWETNGGFMLGSELDINGKILKALPTRDAVLPILCGLLAAKQQELAVSELFARLPQRFTSASLIDDIPIEQINTFRSLYADLPAMQRLADSVFGSTSLGAVDTMDTTDGLRLVFQSREVVHLRPSGNAPQFRVYTTADTQDRADELAGQATAADGFIIKLLEQLK